MGYNDRVNQDEFKHKLKEEWSFLWQERFDDKVNAEGIAARDYPMLFMDRGIVIFASRDARTPTFSEIVETWASQGIMWDPSPSIGGWGRFIRTELPKRVHSRSRVYESPPSRSKVSKQQLKKGGRGWLHK